MVFPPLSLFLFLHFNPFGLQLRRCFCRYLTGKSDPFLYDCFLEKNDYVQQQKTDRRTSLRAKFSVFRKRK